MSNIDYLLSSTEIITSKQDKIIRNYRILKYVGAGSFGKVYLCEHIGTKI